MIPAAVRAAAALFWLLPSLAGAQASERVIRVGTDQPVRSIAVAASLVQDGGTIEVAPGDYVADVAVWTKNRITVRASGGRARLVAAGASAEQKAIWVVRGGAMTVENFDFTGARVTDRNGAAIRFEKGRLTVRNCTFLDNENGILTGSDPNAELTIENSEFGRNGSGDGRTHNLYVAAIRRLTVTGSYFHHARVGHLLKSRAAENLIMYNRLTDEIGGRASYELEFPNGGLAYVIGNIIQQGSQTENPHLISFGAEGYRHPRNELYLSHNTLVDDRPQGGIFLRVKEGGALVKAVDNLLVGKGKLETASPGEFAANFNVGYEDLARAVREDYRVRAESPVVGKAVDAGRIDGQSLVPDREYVHPHRTQLLAQQPRTPGALQSLAR